MDKGIEHIGKKDIAWSYAATAFMVGAGVLLFPFILNKMPPETVMVWNIFQTITMLVVLLDFGFRPSFARNVSYILHGARTLRREGVEETTEGEVIDYALLKGTLKAMQRFYRWMAIAVFALLVTGGTAYFHYILGKYNGDHRDALVAWILLIAINCYNLYTYYYDALLLGKGYVKRAQQIAILGQSIYLVMAIGLIYAGLGLSAIVGSQLVSTIIKRVMMQRVFFTADMKGKLNESSYRDPGLILQTISPNAIKMGLTQLGGFCVNRSAMLMGTAYLSLEGMACYGITMQVMDVVGRCGLVMYQSYTPKLAAIRMDRDMVSMKRYYVYSVMSLIIIYLAGGAAWMLAGDWALQVINSQTPFVPMGMLAVMLVISLLEQNHTLAAGFIMAENKIPFFIPSLLSGAATIGLLYVMLGVMDMGVWGLILAPGLAQLAYQNWKWPSVVIRDIRRGAGSRK